MAYENTTWVALRTLLLNRLGNDDFWTDNHATYPEMSSLIREALYYWGIISYSFTDRIAVTLPANARSFDLTTIAPFKSTLTSYTVVAEIQDHLLEPVNPAKWTGSEMFTLPQISEVLRRRRDQFLLETGIDVDHAALTKLTESGQPRYEMPDDVLDVRRISLKDLDGDYIHVPRGDGLVASNSPVLLIEPAAPTLPGPPKVYIVAETRPNQIEFVWPPRDKFTVDLFSVRSGATFTSNNDVALGVPDEFLWGIKYGAMADLLGNEGAARDVQRAQYCETRFQQAVKLARQYPSVLRATKDTSTDIPLTTLQKLDMLEPDWENEAAGTVKAIVVVGRNLLVPYPSPASALQIVLDVVKPAAIPGTDATFVDVNEGAIQVLVDYAQHVAAFKEAGAEFDATVRQADNCIRLAIVENQRLKAKGLFIEQMMIASQRSEQDVLRRVEPQPSETTVPSHA